MDSKPQPVEDDGQADMDRAFARLNNQQTTQFGNNFSSNSDQLNGSQL